MVYTKFVFVFTESRSATKCKRLKPFGQSPKFDMFDLHFQRLVKVNMKFGCCNVERCSKLEKRILHFVTRRAIKNVLWKLCVVQKCQPIFPKFFANVGNFGNAKKEQLWCFFKFFPFGTSLIIFEVCCRKI